MHIISGYMKMKTHIPPIPDVPRRQISLFPPFQPFLGTFNMALFDDMIDSDEEVGSSSSMP